MPRSTSPTSFFRSLVDSAQSLAGITIVVMLGFLSSVTGSAQQFDTLFGSNVISADTVNLAATRLSLHTSLDKYPESVTFILTVHDSSNHFVAGLAPPYMKGDRYASFWRSVVEKEGEKEHEVKDFEVSEFRGTVTDPVAIALVLDYSGSMSGSVSQMEDGALNACRSLDTNYPIALVKFDHSVEVAHEMGAGGFNISHYLTGIGGFGGGTALYDAAMAGLSELGKTKHKRKIMILFTDGSDNSSLFTLPSALVERARKEGVTIHTIAYGNADQYTLNYLSNSTGGRSMSTRSSSEISRLLTELFLVNQVHYRLTYRPPSYRGMHTVMIRAGVNDSLLSLGEARYRYEWNVDSLDRMEPKAVALFPFDASKKPLYSGGLEKLAEYLKQNPKVRIRLTGYADSEGPAAYNKQLSTQRALTVKRYIVSLGARSRQISVAGRGEANPIHRPDWPDRQKALENRRVEVEFLKGK